MYVYACSNDNTATYPDNIPEHFTFTLSQTLRGANCRLGLIELSIHPKVGGDIAEGIDMDNGFVYVLVPQCKDSEAHSHKHPIIRSVALREFAAAAQTPVIRFPNVQYINIKEYHLSDITVLIRPCESPGNAYGPCCKPTEGFLQGVTRCTFHIIGHDV